MDAILKSAGESVLKFYESPPCPCLPTLSVTADVFLGAVRAILVWMGLPLGPLSHAFWAVHWRAEKVRWALKPKEERMKLLFTVGMIGMVALPFLLGRGGGDTTVKLVYVPRPPGSAA
jgi:hypothetical protein